MPTDRVSCVSEVKTADPDGKEAVTVTTVGRLRSDRADGCALRLMVCGAASPSARATVASETVKPAASPDTVIASELSPATSSSVSDKLNEPEPLDRPAGMVTVKSPTAA